MKILDAEQMQKADRSAITDFGIPEIVLMENAGIKTVQAICEEFPDVHVRNVLVVCGPGNNGGDGFVIARHLHNIGTTVNVVTTQSAQKYRGVQADNLEILKKMNIPVTEIVSEPAIYEAMNLANYSDVIVDAIFGTGLRKKVEGLYDALINGINSVSAPKVSVDIPSGVDGSTGLVMGCAVKASMTVALASLKIGHVLDPGSQYTGKLYIADISIPRVLLESADFRINLTTEEYVSRKLPKRAAASNKGDFGRALLIGGSALYSGAPRIARDALLRSGAGVSYVLVPDSIVPALKQDGEDAIVSGLRQNGAGCIGACEENIAAAMDFIEKRKITAIGMGMGAGDHPETQEFFAALLARIELPVCLDADGLLALKKFREKIAANKKLRLVITPHPKEMAKILGVNPEQVLMERISTCAGYSADNGFVTLLKGHRTIVCSPSGEMYINASGNPAMAKGGMGDALTGLITGLMAAGTDPFHAAVCGAYIHGRAGDIALADIFEYCMTTADLIARIPSAMAAIKGGPNKNNKTKQ